MNNITEKVIKFTEETMKNWRVELTVGGIGLAEEKIQRFIFQGEALLPLLFIIARILLSHILRKFIGGNKLTKSQEKICHLIYMHDI